MKIKTFFTYILSSDPRRDEIISSLLNKDKQTLYLNKEVTTVFKNHIGHYIPWLLKHTKQNSIEISQSIFDSIKKFY